MCVGVEGEYMGTIISAQFCCGPKTSPKNSILMKKKTKKLNLFASEVNDQWPGSHLNYQNNFPTSPLESLVFKYLGLLLGVITLYHSRRGKKSDFKGGRKEIWKDGLTIRRVSEFLRQRNI